MDLDCEKLLGNVLGPEAIQIARETIRMLLDFLPSVGPPLCHMLSLQQNQTANCVGTIIPRIVPLLQSVIMNELPASDFALLALTQALSFARQRFSSQIYPKLAAFGTDLECAPIVIYCANVLGDPNIRVSAGVFHALEATVVSMDRLDQWYKSVLEELARKCQNAFPTSIQEFETLRDLVDFLNEGDITPFTFEAGGLIGPIVKLIQKWNKAVLIDIMVLRDLCDGRLGSVLIPHAEANRFECSATTIAETSLAYTISCQGRTYWGIEIRASGSFIDFEAWVNENHGVSATELMKVIPDGSQSRLDTMSLTEKGFLHRHCNT
jgi:hypothetical protein